MHSGVNAAQRVFQPHQLSNSVGNYYDTQSNSSINTKMSKTLSNTSTTGGRRKRERPRPNGSCLLTDNENEQLFKVYLFCLIKICFFTKYNL